MESPSSKMLKKCFLCTKEFKGSEAKTDFLSESDRSFLFCQVFGLPLDDTKNNLVRLMFQNACYCSDCLEIVSSLSCMSSDLQILEDKVSTEKRNIVDKLRNSCAKVSNQANSPPGMLQVLRSQIITEIDNITGKPSRSCDPSNTTGEKRQGRPHSKATQTEIIHDNPTRKVNHPSNQISAERDSENLVSSVNSECNFVAAVTGVENGMTLLSAWSEYQPVNDEDSSSSDEELADIEVPSSISLKVEEEKFTFCHSEVGPVDIVDPLSVANIGKELDHEIPEQIRKRSYICGTCNEVFVDYASLKAHDSIHHKILSSNLTNTRNKRKSDKSARTVKHAIPEGTTTQHKKSISAVKKRIRTSAFYQPKKCEECEKILSNQGTWKTHVLTVHRREGKHKCKSCDFSCLHPAAMENHKLSRHSDVRSFKCEVCNKNFKQKSQLKEHGRIHVGITPYQCQLCSAGFNYATSLRRHEIDGDCLNLETNEKKSTPKKDSKR